MCAQDTAFELAGKRISVQSTQRTTFQAVDGNVYREVQHMLQNGE